MHIMINMYNTTIYMSDLEEISMQKWLVRWRMVATVITLVEKKKNIFVRLGFRVQTVGEIVCIQRKITAPSKVSNGKYYVDKLAVYLMKILCFDSNI